MTIELSLLLTPLLILAIVALVRFTGCYHLPPNVHPHLLTLIPGDQKITLIWEDEAFNSYSIKRSTTPGGPYSTIASTPAGTASYVDTGLTNGTLYFYVLSAFVSSDEQTTNSNELSATPEADVAVTFDNPAPPGNPGAPLNGVYKNLDFGNGAWFWVDPALGMGPANAININSGPNPGAGDITFANGPRYLERIRVFPKRVGNVSITDSGASPQNPQVVVVYQTADLNTIHFVDTGWTVPTQKFTVAADIGFDLDIDTIVYTGPP